MEYIRRDLEDKVKKYLPKKEIISIVGPRQCGKTTFVNHILNNIKNKKINRISFDDVKTLDLFENDIDSFIELHVRGYDILFIDEVQYSKESGKKLKYIYDNNKVKILISGSSAAELSTQSLKYLVGRIFTFTLHPFSFREFLKSKNPAFLKLYDSANYKEEILSQMNRYLQEYIQYGGYPRVVISESYEEKVIVLRNIYNTFLLREIRDIMDLSHDYKLMRLIKALSLQTGNILNYKDLMDVADTSHQELKKYMNILEKTYICAFVRPFYTNKRTELVKSPKIYFFDTGFRNICLDNFNTERTDMGALYENFIFSELSKQDLYPKYWHTKSKAEVDFIIEKEGEIVPIEIKSSLKGSNLTRSFHNFIEKYSPERSYLLSLNYESSKELNKTKVSFLPLVKFTSMRI